MKRVALIILLLFCAGASDPASASGLFEEHSVIDIELIGPISRLIENREQREEYPFELRSDGLQLDIQVRVRGKSRVRVCDFPPLRLNFQRSETLGTEFEETSKLKLVTHCLEGPSGQVNAIEEYIAYRIFNFLSEMSYRVRLLRINYIDPEDKERQEQPNFGFVIEPKEQLARRTATQTQQIPALRLSQLEREHLALVYVFQYMIGNTDWSFVLADGDDACCHNGDLFEAGEILFYVPYDFDLSGIVSARYAKPDPSMRLRNVRSRRYRGFCMDSETMRQGLVRVTAQKQRIIDMVRATPGLTGKETEKIAAYLLQFFDKADNEKKLLKSFERQCLD